MAYGHLQLIWAYGHLQRTGVCEYQTASQNDLGVRPLAAYSVNTKQSHKLISVYGELSFRLKFLQNDIKLIFRSPQNVASAHEQAAKRLRRQDKNLKNEIS